LSNLAYLGSAVVISLVGCLLLWLRNRKPQSMEAHMEAFARELRALAPEPDGRQRRQQSTRDGRGRRSG
jgi:hypothetical protein